MSEIPVSGITRTVGVCGGRPCIAGTRIRVTDIVTAVQLQYSRSEIAEDFAISHERVDAALCYYEHNKAAIDADIRRQDKTFDRLSKSGYGRPQHTLLPQ